MRNQKSVIENQYSNKKVELQKAKRGEIRISNLGKKLLLPLIFSKL